MSILDQFKVKPHPVKAELKKFNVATGTLSNFLDLSYPYVCNILNGQFRMPKHHERKIKSLLYTLEQEAQEQ